LNHSGNDRAAEGEQTPRGMMKEREPKDDGRYIIYYTFEDEEEGED
jgi:hypothetical protein